ncbi:MAG: DUF952 domain-containing protein [Pyrinomonadaceae bacterium]|nr:DUF952 domain-containing protein [Pyrinomonadaceae bacterium]
MEKIIYHFALPEVWAKFANEDFYEAESLRTEGFNHCSFANQLEGVLARHFKNVEKVVILHIDKDLLTSKLVVEPSTNQELYPHIYGQINRDSIVKIEERDLTTNS